MRRPKFFNGNIWEANWTVWEWTESVRVLRVYVDSIVAYQRVRVDQRAAYCPIVARIGRVIRPRILAYPERMGAYPCVSAVNSVRIRVLDLSPIAVDLIRVEARAGSSGVRRERVCLGIQSR